MRDEMPLSPLATMVRFTEAGAAADSIGDKDLRAFVKYGLTTVITGRGMNSAVTPEGQFDLRFLVEALRAIGSNREDLLLILQGKSSDLAWWPEEL